MAVPGIAKPQQLPREQRRLSYTFRQVRRTPCKCAFPKCCDSQAQDIPPTRLMKLGLLGRHGESSPYAADGAEGGEGEEGRCPGGSSDTGAGTQGGAGTVEGREEDVTGEVSTQGVERGADRKRGGMGKGEDGEGEGKGAGVGVSGRGGVCQNRGVTNGKGVPPDLEAKHVQDVYDAIAPHFSATRFAGRCLESAVHILVPLQTC